VTADASHETDRVCRACGSDDLEDIWEAMEPGFQILACHGCGTLRTWPETPDDEIGKWYPQAYYGDENVRFNPVMEKMTHWFAIRRARGMAKGMSPGRVLDVGCGRGMMLKAFGEIGWTPKGVEFSDDSAWHARERLGIPVHTGPLEDIDDEDASYDLIIFWHSLEHFRRPDEALEVARRLLRAGGRLVVAVPNAESLQAKLFGRQWFHLDVPRHHHHFGTTSLRRMMEREGFLIDEVRHLNLEQNPYGALQSLMNKLGFPENFLYSMLKTESARTHEVKDHPGLAFATLALLPTATMFAGALTALEVAAGKGGTIEVHATR
jgi:SAM-dependent methyltransferase